VFVLQLGARDFNDTAVCLGPQVAAVLETLMALPKLSESDWYAACVEVISLDQEALAAMAPYETVDRAFIADVDAFVALSRSVTQYLEGIFYAVPDGVAPEIPNAFSMNDPLDKLVSNSIVEVRADDTTWIEVATDSRSIVEQAQQRFGGNVLAG
jgi:hypothetical protein